MSHFHCYGSERLNRREVIVTLWRRRYLLPTPGRSDVFSALVIIVDGGYLTVLLLATSLPRGVQVVICFALLPGFEMEVIYLYRCRMLT